jgi:hypothetical protein
MRRIAETEDALKLHTGAFQRGCVPEMCFTGRMDIVCLLYWRLDRAE